LKKLYDQKQKLNNQPFISFYQVFPSCDNRQKVSRHH